MKRRFFHNFSAAWSRIRAALRILRRGVEALEAVTPDERAAILATRADVAEFLGALHAFAQTHGRDLTIDETVYQTAKTLYRDLSLDTRAAQHFCAAFAALRAPGGEA